MPDPPPPAPPKRAATTSAQHPDLRFRGPRRKTSAQSLSSSHSRSPAPLPDRRASTFSLSSIDELSHSLTSDLINPSFTRPQPSFRDGEDDEVTNWHSTPLLFALLPAVGGVLFKEGAAVVTDLLILGLAAIFLNWSVRLPWDWYYAAQKVVGREGEGEAEGGRDEDVIEEEEEDDETGNAHGDGAVEKKKPEERDGVKDRMAAVMERQEEALAGLRTQEIMALGSTFIFPALAAYLLHVLRGQLSKSSTGLVSDYNLSIFLLVAEIRPCRQLIRLIERRTLHLQRTVNGSSDPFGDSDATGKGELDKLSLRLSELEQQMQSQAASSMNGHASHVNPSQLEDLATEMKKRYESRIDALERAVRRYEKRTTTLAMVTEQRLKAIDARLSDTLSLAAVAAEQSTQRSAAGRMLDACLTMLMLPLRIGALMVMWPVRVLEDAYARIKGLLFGQPRAKGKKRASGPRDGKVIERRSVRRVDEPR